DKYGPESKQSGELQGHDQKCADEDEELADREGGVEILVELRTDRERQGLRHALQVAREDDRGTELPEAPRERQCRRSAEAACGERERHAREHPCRSCPECPRGVDQYSVQRLEGRDCTAKVERALDERDRQHDRGLREGDLHADSVELAA